MINCRIAGAYNIGAYDFMAGLGLSAATPGSSLIFQGGAADSGATAKSGVSQNMSINRYATESLVLTTASANNGAWQGLANFSSETGAGGLNEFQCAQLTFVVSNPIGTNSAYFKWGWGSAGGSVTHGNQADFMGILIDPSKSLSSNIGSGAATNDIYLYCISNSVEVACIDTGVAIPTVGARFYVAAFWNAAFNKFDVWASTTGGTVASANVPTPQATTANLCRNSIALGPVMQYTAATTISVAGGINISPNDWYIAIRKPSGVSNF